MLTKEYKITITNLNFQTPCSGYYVYTGVTHDISQASPINGSQSLIPISNGYTFNVEIESEYTFMYVFIIHCDGYDTTQNLQGGYQVSIADLRCTDCFRGNCVFDVTVEVLEA